MFCNCESNLKLHRYLYKLDILKYKFGSCIWVFAFLYFYTNKKIKIKTIGYNMISRNWAVLYYNICYGFWLILCSYEQNLIIDILCH